MNARRVEITLSQSVWDRLEKRRGDVPRAAFIKRALESALRQPEGQSSGPSDPETRPSLSAPVRAPVVDEDLDAFAAGEVDHSADAAHADLMWERQQRLNKRGKK